MTSTGLEVLKQFCSWAVIIIVVVLLIVLIVSFFTHDIVNAIVMILFAILNYFLFSDFTEATKFSSSEQVIDDASLSIAITCGLWVMARMSPTCRADYEYTGTYLVMGTLYDEYVDSNSGRTGVNVLLSVIIGFGAYFLTNVCLSNDLRWIVNGIFPTIQIVICVIGIIKAANDEL